MSDEDQSNANSQQQQEQQQQNSEEQEEDQDQQNEDQDQEDQGDQDQQQDQQQQSGSGQDQDEEQEQSKEEGQQDDKEKLPTFTPVRQPPQQFKFTSLLSQISSLSSNVDNFIGTLHSSQTSGFNRRPYISNYAAQEPSYPRMQQIKPLQIPSQSRIVIMKDQDTQVDMKPQIIIQPTKAVRQDPVIQAKPYQISTESQKFLAQLYQQNKKLKRWQNNASHPMNSYMSSYGGSNGFAGSKNGFYGSKQKFERKQYQKGLFNVEDRNKQIDDAIMMLKRQE